MRQAIRSVAGGGPTGTSFAKISNCAAQGICSDMEQIDAKAPAASRHVAAARLHGHWSRSLIGRLDRLLCLLLHLPLLIWRSTGKATLQCVADSKSKCKLTRAVVGANRAVRFPDGRRASRCKLLKGVPANAARSCGLPLHAGLQTACRPAGHAALTMRRMLNAACTLRSMCASRAAAGNQGCSVIRYYSGTGVTDVLHQAKDSSVAAFMPDSSATPFRAIRHARKRISLIQTASTHRSQTSLRTVL